MGKGSGKKRASRYECPLIRAAGRTRLPRPRVYGALVNIRCASIDRPGGGGGRGDNKRVLPLASEMLPGEFVLAIVDVGRFFAIGRYRVRLSGPP